MGPMRQNLIFDPILTKIVPEVGFSPISPVFHQNGVEKWDFRKSDMGSFQHGPKPTSGATFVKSESKIRFFAIWPY